MSSHSKDQTPEEAQTSHDSSPSEAETVSAAGGSTSRQIGPYRLMELIAEGGMGEVWMAQQESPVRRTVAVKIIKRGMDTKQVVARFEAERQALAMMDHPCISTVFDAGHTSNGRPFFAMEYVQGLPITNYCDTHKLDVEERLRLFQKVCDAVQHAHQKAVIHRDLKPSNILVTVQGDEAIPKVIDFGVAKATAQPLTERTVYTEMGMLIGTPEYMSPEQAAMTGQDIDTRTDIYSLGIVLYELLVGALPFEPKELRRAGLLEMHRVIREKDPPRPSTRISSLGGAATTNAAARRTQPMALTRELRGDLDWITMKALEKDRTRRYRTTNALALDIERYLSDEPVRARPPSTTYRAGKFIRRHRVAVVAAAMVVIAMIGGASVATWQAISARRAEERALSEAARADREALSASRVADFLASLLESANPYGEDPGRELTVVEALERGVAQINALETEPLVQARLLQVMGEAFMGVGGREDEAQELFDRALAIRERVLDDDDPDLTYHRFERDAYLLGEIGEESRGVVQAVIEAYEDRPGAENRRRLAEALSAMAIVGWILDDDVSAADQRSREALEILRELETSSGQSLPDTVDALRNLGAIAMARNDPYAARTYYSEGVAKVREIWGSRDARYAMMVGQLATVVRDIGEYDEAERLAREALAVRREALGPDHYNVLYDLAVLASVQRARGQPASAAKTYGEMIELARQTGADDSAEDVCAMAEALVASGRVTEANELLQRVGTEGAADALICRLARGLLQIHSGRVDTGDFQVVEVLEDYRASDPLNYRVRGVASELVDYYEGSSDVERASQWSRRLEAWKSNDGDGVRGQ